MCCSRCPKLRQELSLRQLTINFIATFIYFSYFSFNDLTVQIFLKSTLMLTFEKSIGLTKLISLRTFEKRTIGQVAASPDRRILTFQLLWLKNNHVSKNFVYLESLFIRLVPHWILFFLSQLSFYIFVFRAKDFHRFFFSVVSVWSLKFPKTCRCRWTIHCKKIVFFW